MSFIDHLEELRQRILISFVAILIVTVVALIFSDNILNILLIPSGGLRLTAFSLMDGFMIKFHISIYLGIAAAFPIWGFHLYRFFSPALLEHERRAVLPALVFSTLLFAGGVAFGYFLLYEVIQVLISIFPTQVDFLPAAQGYISFVLFFLLTFGLAFQLPVLLTILIHLRLLSTDLLRAQRRIAYFILFVIAELICPVPDPILAPLGIMLPLVILYEISILAGRRIESQRLKASLQEEHKMARADSAEILPTPEDEGVPALVGGRFCTQCGAAAKTLDARYCNNCGNPLGKLEPLV
jgi:sec-independent protein translocase protein TatC